jgi:glycosyltransferase involved in cell wall biosynthesis
VSVRYNEGLMNSQEKPAIYVFSTAYRPFIGGAELAVQNIASRLRDDFNFYILTARLDSTLKKEEIVQEGTILRFGVGIPFVDKLFLPLLIFLYFISNPIHKKSILWGVMVSYASIGAFFVKLFRPTINFVLTLQEGDEEWRPRIRNIGMASVWWRLIFWKVNYVTAISKYLAEIAKTKGYSGKIMIIPNGVDDALLSIPERTNTNKFTIFSASRLVEKNGIDILIRAVSKIKSEKDFKIIIAGDGPERSSLVKLADSLGLGEKINFLGKVSPNKVYEYYKVADVFVRPSRTEGLGSAFLEAMASGCITIGTRVGGISEFLKDGETGFVAEPDDVNSVAEKLDKALALPEKERDQIVNKARQLIKEHFLWSKIAEDMKAVFLSVI